MAFQNGNGKLFILVVEGQDEQGQTTWRQVKTYWAKKDGSKSKHITDLVGFWSRSLSTVPPVKLSLFSVDTSKATPEQL